MKPKSVRDFMSTNVTTVNPEMGIMDLAQMLQENTFQTTSGCGK
tara:strand:- start:373 stop:504 length:132 start_codon:yes stop_codon:yes gene_type:complete